MQLVGLLKGCEVSALCLLFLAVNQDGDSIPGRFLRPGRRQVSQALAKQRHLNLMLVGTRTRIGTRTRQGFR